MAKKSSSKAKTGNLLLDLLALIFSAGIFGLLAMPYVKYEVSSVIGSASSQSSGYQLLDFEANAGVSTMILLLIIFASISILFAIVKMLVDAKILKGKNAVKLANFGLIVMTLILTVISIVSIIVIASNCGANGFGSIVSAGSYAGWFGLILTVVCSGLAFVSSIFSVKR